MIPTGEDSELTLDDYIELIQPKIAYCNYDQPYDGGDVVWILGTCLTLNELFDIYDVPENDTLRDELAGSLHCEGCGVDLERYDQIGEKTEEELEADEKWAEWHLQYLPKIEEFGEFLAKYPYLGADHDLGKELLLKITEFPSIDIEGEFWWRARKPIGGKLLKPKDMRPPKYAEAEGRFNHFGQSVFYLASEKEAALKEILDEDECIAWVQRFKVKEAKNILDLSAFISVNEEYPILALGLNIELPSMIPDKESPWKPEYFVPRFIADCAKLKGFNGIKFKSEKHYKDNLVIFAWDSSSIKPMGKPAILELKKPKGKRKPKIEALFGS